MRPTHKRRALAETHITGGSVGVTDKVEKFASRIDYTGGGGLASGFLMNQYLRDYRGSLELKEGL